MESSKKKSLKVYLLALSNDKLKEICKTYKIKGFSKLKKKELILSILTSIPTHIFEEFYKKIET